MNKTKIISIFLVLVIFSVNLFAKDAKKRASIDAFFKSYVQMVELAEKAAKNDSKKDMLKVEGKMTGLSAQFAFLKLSSEWTDADTKKYKELTSRYGKAHSTMAKKTFND